MEKQAGRSNNHIDIEQWLSDGDISESALAEINKLREYPALFNSVAWKCHELSADISDEISESMMLKIISGTIKCDYHADHALNFETVPYEIRDSWRFFNRRECTKCRSPGKVIFLNEIPGYRKFCIDHDCYSKKLRDARNAQRGRE